MIGLVGLGHPPVKPGDFVLVRSSIGGVMTGYVSQTSNRALRVAGSLRIETVPLSSLIRVIRDRA